MEQLSLFPELEIKKKKQAKLGRYERLQRELENAQDDFQKIFIDIEEKPAKYNFVDVFSGAGGMSQGLLKAGFEPIVSVEIHEIASATYQKNFPNCFHICDDIHKFNPLEI